MRKNIIIFSSLLFFSIFNAVNVFPDDMDIIKTRIYNYFTAYGANGSDPDVAATIADLNTVAQGYADSINPDGSWSDMDCSQMPSNSTGYRPQSTHLGRLLKMAQAYKVEGQSLYNDSALRDKIEKGVEHINIYVYDGCTINAYWYQWEITYTMLAGPLLILMENDIDPSIINVTLGAISYLIGDAPSSGGGSNGAEMITNHLYYALLSNNTDRMNLIKSKVTSSVFVSGTQYDYSYQYHGDLVYTAGYGAAYAKAGVILAYFLDGTTYEMSTSNFNSIMNFTFYGLMWCSYHSYFDFTMVGRSITRTTPFTGFSHGTFIFFTMANTPCTIQDDFIAGSKKLMETNTNLLQLEIAGFYTAIRNSSVETAWPSGHRHYNYSDYSIHRRPDYYMSVKMLSSRVMDYESISSENKRGWHISDGMTYILLDGDEYLKGNVRPTLDWKRLPGITVEQNPRSTASHTGTRGTREFVGGTRSQDYGVSVMDFDAVDSEITAKKSYFFFEEELVCLGSDIDCPTSYVSETIVNQWPLSAADATLTVDGSVKTSPLGWSETLNGITWAHCDGIGYYFPGGATVKGKREEQTGLWSNIRYDTSTEIHYTPFLTFWFDHGTYASNETYKYSIVPNKTSSEMVNYVASDPVTVLSHTANIHAVKNNNLNAVGVVVWNSSGGTIDKITTDSSCCVYYDTKGNLFTIAACYPPHTSKTFNITVNEELTEVSLPSGVSSSASSGETIITFNVTAGKNYLATFITSAGDSTPPYNITSVNDGMGQDIDTTASTSQLSANWTESDDPESGILRYEYAIGTTAGGTDIVGWNSTSNGTVTDATESGLSLTVGVTYYFTVKAINGVLLRRMRYRL
jgi:hyaluronate lyase